MPSFPRGLFLIVCLITCAACGDSPGAAPTVATPPATTPPPAPPPAPEPAPPPAPAPVEPAALDSLSISPSSILSQSSAQGTVRLTREAPSEGAVIALASSVVDAARTPASVMIPGGSTSATFTASSPTVGRELRTIISATYLGVVRTATLTVGPPVLEAVFTTTWGGSRCYIANAAGRLNCSLDASESRGFPTFYNWTLDNNGKTVKLTTRVPVIDAPTDCDFLGGQRLDTSNEFPIRIDLQVETGEGVKSGNATQTIKIMPFGTGVRGYCGYF